MSRYIDVNLAIDEIIKDMCGVPNIDEGLSTAISELRLIPTADVIPIEWIKEQKDKCFPDSITAIALKHLLTEWERREDER